MIKVTCTRILWISDFCYRYLELMMQAQQLDKVNSIDFVDVNFFLFGVAVMSLGTSSLHWTALKDLCELKYFGCFALTELAHGSNVQGIGTTATYDHNTWEIVLNTPRAEDMKFWIGHLGKTASKAVVFA